MKAIRTISVVSGRPEDSGKRIKVGLFRGFDRMYRWYGGNPGDQPQPIPAQDSEVSGHTVAQACAEARRAWAGSAWGARASWF